MMRQRKLRKVQLVTKDKFDEIVSRLSLPGEYGTDTETTGSSESDSLFSVIIADAEDSYYFNFNSSPDHLGDYPPDDCILPREWIIKLQPIFNNQEQIHYIQNAKFDMRMLAKEGIKFYCQIRCTEVSGRVLQNNLLSYRLKDQAPRHLGEHKDEAVDFYIKTHKLETKYRVPGKKKILSKPHFDQVPFDIITKYGGHDAYLHRKLGRYFTEAIGKNKDIARVAENEWRLTETCFRMERLGVKIDRQFTSDGLKHEVNLLEKSKSAFAALCGEKFDGSKTQLIRVFTAAGEKIPKTVKGNDSLTDDVLSTFKTPAAKAVQLIRTHEKLISTYYSSFLALATESDLIHADIRQAGTETGRFSYRDPNLQNVPKEDEEPEINRPYPVRGCFVPRPDYCFVMIDYSQQEYRMMLDYAGQMDLVRAVMAGADVHQATADLTGLTRKQAKNLNFAILYGAGPEKMASMMNVSIAEAKSLRERYFMKLPFVEMFIRKVIRVGRERGYIRNWLGRHCYISSPEFAYVLPNHLIQGSCADVVKAAMNSLDNYLADKKSRMVLQVHDEILFEIYKDELEIVPEIKKIMESIYPARNGIILEASVEHSWKSWAAKDKVKGFPV